jgi:hypothetical protein
MGTRNDFLIADWKKQGMSHTSAMGYESKKKSSVLSTLVCGFIPYVILQWNLCDETWAELVYKLGPIHHLQL